MSIALARRYRPSNFDDVIGQEIAVQTLQNAIQYDRIPQAILFSGVRGVGKTTLARIVAQALNCIKGPTVNPCGKCGQCTEIASSSNQDVLEIDAASHTGINDIKEILDNAQYSAVFGKYKVYIIDEVHMLSSSAFNACLKTLEEPPPNVKFVFATTEMQKIPLTILSRCQKFNLNRVGIEDLVSHYADILRREGCESEDGVLQIIARAADGSVRDGLSMLDQAISSSTNSLIRVSDVSKMLGSNCTETPFILLKALIGGVIEDVLGTINRLYTDGVDPIMLLRDVLQIITVTTKIRALYDGGVTDIGYVLEEILDGKYKEEIKNWAKLLPAAFWIRVWQALMRASTDIRNSVEPWMVVELAFIHLIYVNLYETPETALKSVTKRNEDTEHVPMNKNIKEKPLPIEEKDLLQSQLVQDIIETFGEGVTVDTKVKEKT